MKTETVVLTPIAVNSIDASATMDAGSTATLTVVLSVPAPDGGVTVRLNGNRPSVLAVPSSVIVPGGSSSADVTVAAYSHSEDADVTLKARLDGGSWVTGATTVLGIAPPIATVEPTETVEPTMTATVEPTETVEPTTTVEPTATPEVTVTATPQAHGPVTFTPVHVDYDWATFNVCMTDAPDVPVTVQMGWLSTDENPVLIFPSTLTMSLATPCTVIDFFVSSEITLDPVTVTLTASVSGADYASEPILFDYSGEP